MAASRFPAVRDHVLLRWASPIPEADRRLRPRLGEPLFAELVEQIPEDWLRPPGGDPDLTPADRRAGYVEFLTQRLAAASAFVEEAENARAHLV